MTAILHSILILALLGAADLANAQVLAVTAPAEQGAPDAPGAEHPHLPADDGTVIAPLPGGGDGGGGTEPDEVLIEAEEATFGGTACFNWDDSPTIITAREILIPIRTFVKRDSGSSLKRGTCAFALPLKVPAGKRLVLKQLAIENLVNLSAGATSRADIEIFTAGTRAPALNITEKAEGEPLRQIQSVVADLGFASGCGEALTLRANTAALVMGGSGKASSKLDNLTVRYELEDCQ